MIDDYTAALQAASLFELPGAGVVEVRGPDAAIFLNNVGTNDFVNLPDGHGCETYFCDHRAKALFHAFVRRFSKETFLLDTEPGFGPKLYQHLNRYLISEAVELVDRTAEITVHHCCGPLAERFAGGGLAEFQHAPRPLGTLAADFRRRDCLGVAGFDLFIPHAEAAALRLYLQGEGVVLGSAETLECLRIEAGTPVYGKDIDENRFVMEVANAARAVSYTKGCFIGQEPIVMSRDRAGGVNKIFVGLSINSKQATPNPGFKVFQDKKEVGIVTSTTWSPRMNHAIGLGYVKRGFHEPGTELSDEGGVLAKVLGYPPLP